MKYLTRKNVIIISIIAVILWIVGPYLGVKTSANPDIHEGDVVFQYSGSSQSPLIAMATGSPLTHCGIVVMRGGQPYVLEASGRLQVVSFKKWIARSKGVYWVKHPKVHDGDIKIRYSHLLGRRYDLSFSFNNNLYYCSELVYDIYKYQLGVELCKPRKVKEYNIIGMKKVMRRRGISPNQLVVAPSDVFDSDYWK